MDLTGGVTSLLLPANILDKNKFWTDELMNVNKLFLFGIHTRLIGKSKTREWLVRRHSYSILEAKELENFRLLKLRYYPKIA